MIDLPFPRVGLPLAPAPACDCRICPFNMDNPQAVEPICAGCSTACESCTCAASAGPTEEHADACAGCAVRCGSRTDILAWMNDVGNTLLFDDIHVHGSLPTLPAFIPQVDGRVASLDGRLSWPAYAIGLRRVLSPTTFEVSRTFKSRSAHRALGLKVGQRAVLVGYGEDGLVEAYWSHRHSRRIAADIAAMEWDLVLAPNMSVYANQPRAENLINMRRNLIVAAELADLGVPAVPCVYWLRLEDLDRYAAWSNDNAQRLPGLAVNLQTFRTPADWEEIALPGLAFLAATLPEDLPVIVTGSSTVDRIGQLLKFFGPRLHLVSQHALQLARHGIAITTAGEIARPSLAEDLFTVNVRHYARLLAEPERVDGGSR